MKFPLLRYIFIPGIGFVLWWCVEGMPVSAVHSEQPWSERR